MAALASALTESTVGAPDETGSEALLDRYGWPTETAAMRTFNAMHRGADQRPHVPRLLPATSDVAGAAEYAVQSAAV